MLEEIKTEIVAVHKEVKRKFQLPIIITYSVVLIIYNWDILFYLAFEAKSAIYKIQYIKNIFYTTYGDRIWKPIILSLIYSILFPFIQLIINQIVQFIRRNNNKITRKEELDNAIHNFEVQQQLTGQQSLQQLQNKIDQLLIEKEMLLSSNNSLLGQIKTESNDKLNTSQIFDSQFDEISKLLLDEINELKDEEKSTVVEIMNYIETHDDSYSLNGLKSNTVFEANFTKAFSLILKHKLVEKTSSSGDYYRTTKLGFKFIPYFKSKYIK